MRLYLVQHGDALSKEEDPERPLSRKGREDVSRLARLLEGSGLRVAAVYHSGKMRAHQTAELLGAAMGQAEHISEMAGLGPQDTTDTVMEKITGWQEDTMIVGHLPFMGRLAARLVTGTEEQDKVAFQPGTMVCVDVDMQEGEKGRIAWMLNPEVI